jgi:mono/diheme cytochrome c family protein
MGRHATTLGAVFGVGLMALAGFTTANAQDDAALIATLVDEGEPLYARNCAVCHGADGGGGEGPTLVGNANLTYISSIATQVIYGGAYMPPFANRFTNREIAALATFVRNSWENAFGVVTEEQIAGYR